MATLLPPKIPFSFLPPKVLLHFSDHYMNIAAKLNKVVPYLDLELTRADLKINSRRYLAMCLVADTFLFFFLAIFLTLFLIRRGDYFLGFFLAVFLTFVILLFQFNYPKLASNRRTRKLDADLLAALRAIMIQLNSGVPLFDAMATIANQEFGVVSQEFRETVKKINAGYPQIDALETMALRNPSPYFRRTIWQITNAMKEGAAINKVVTNIITNLTKEQIIQIEKYGSQLNPLAMFYMMGAVILPVLAITFAIVITSFLQLEEPLIKTVFLSILFLVVFFQFIFSGIVKTKRPSLLGD